MSEKQGKRNKEVALRHLFSGFLLGILGFALCLCGSKA